MLGRREIPGKGVMEFFATSDPEGLVILRTGERLLAISPPDPAAFNQAFIDATRMGALKRVEPVSRRPAFLSQLILTDRAASLLLAAGLVLPFLLLGLLAVRIPTLPAEVPFGFGVDGDVNVWVPPARLLLLPLICGLCYAANTLAGVLAYRSERDRPLAYTLWSMSILVTLLFGGAVVQLLSTA